MRDWHYDVGKWGNEWIIQIKNSREMDQKRSKKETRSRVMNDAWCV